MLIIFFFIAFALFMFHSLGLITATYWYTILNTPTSSQYFSAVVDTVRTEGFFSSWKRASFEKPTVPFHTDISIQLQWQMYELVYYGPENRCAEWRVLSLQGELGPVGEDCTRWGGGCCAYSNSWFWPCQGGQLSTKGVPGPPKEQNLHPATALEFCTFKRRRSPHRERTTAKSA